jgi:hypothetical protein
MEPMVLTDPDQHPTDEIIYSHLGKIKPLWISLFKHIETKHPDFIQEWRYYRDGKSWLLKTTYKKKTIFWLSIVKGAFRTTFYFTDKAKGLLLSSNLSDDLKQQFTDNKSGGKIKGITVVHSKKQNIEDAKILMNIKLQVK